MIRVAILYNDGTTKGFNVENQKEADELVLKEDERKGVKRADTVKNKDRETRKKIW